MNNYNSMLLFDFFAYFFGPSSELLVGFDKIGNCFAGMEDCGVVFVAALQPDD